MRLYHLKITSQKNTTVNSLKSLSSFQKNIISKQILIAHNYKNSIEKQFNSEEKY